MTEGEESNKGIPFISGWSVAQILTLEKIFLPTGRTAKKGSTWTPLTGSSTTWKQLQRKTPLVS